MCLAHSSRIDLGCIPVICRCLDLRCTAEPWKLHYGPIDETWVNHKFSKMNRWKPFKVLFPSLCSFLLFSLFFFFSSFLASGIPSTMVYTVIMSCSEASPVHRHVSVFFFRLLVIFNHTSFLPIKNSNHRQNT